MEEKDRGYGRVEAGVDAAADSKAQWWNGHVVGRETGGLRDRSEAMEHRERGHPYDEDRRPHSGRSELLFPRRLNAGWTEDYLLQVLALETHNGQSPASYRRGAGLGLGFVHSSCVSQGIDQPVVQIGWEFVNVRFGGRH